MSYLIGPGNPDYYKVPSGKVGKARQALFEQAFDRAVDFGLTTFPPFAPEVRETDPDTGGQKGQKPEQYSLIPTEALAAVAKVYAYGAQKYARQNWRKGYAWHLSYDAMQRHLNAFWSGEEIDPESGLPHLAHAIFHCMTLLVYTNDEKYKTKDDRA